MSKEYELFPYRGIGELFFGMTREEIQRLLGKPISSNKYGFPIQDRICLLYTSPSPRDS